MRHKLTAELNY